MEAHVVTGRIVLRGWTGERGPARLSIRLLDTSRIDAAALTIAEVTLPDVHLDAVAREGLPFRLQVEALDRRARLEVSVHVDFAGDGHLRSGDYVNMQAYPVLTRGYPSDVEVEAQRVP